MIRKLPFRATALAAVIAVALSACGSGSGGGSGSGPGFNLASQQELNPSTKTGGTLNLITGLSGFDNMDPGGTYLGVTWNLFRTFSRTMLAFPHKIGDKQLVGDLATGPGVVSNNGKTWTYTLRQGATFEDGSAITSKDVKWAIERSNWSDYLKGNGPTYFYNILTPPDLPQFAKFENLDVYKDGDAAFDKIIETPDDHTIVFNLPRPFGEFDYAMTLLQTAPVPYQRDLKDPEGYAKKPMSSGAYKITYYDPTKELKLVKNEAYNSQSDPEHLHPTTVDTIDLQIGVDATERDERLLDGQADVDLGSALNVANYARVLQDPALKSQTDDSPDGSLIYASINTEVIPNLDCRKAIEYGIDKSTVLNELGGQWGGSIANRMLPDDIPGPKPTSVMYPFNANAAHDSLAACKAKNPELFDANGQLDFKLAVQTNNPDQQNAATAIQASLKQVGINADIKLYPYGGFATQYCGNPAYALNHQLGMCISVWAADWPSGYGFLDQLVTEHGIGQNGGTNYSYLKDPKLLQIESQALSTNVLATQQQAWAQMDEVTMQDAAFVPLVQRNVLRFRSSRLTNVMINDAGEGAYDLSVLGVK